MIRHDEVLILAAVEERLTSVANFVRAAAYRLGESDPLRDLLEEILESVEDAADNTRGTQEALRDDAPGTTGERVTRSSSEVRDRVASSVGARAVCQRDRPAPHLGVTAAEMTQTPRDRHEMLPGGVAKPSSARLRDGADG